MGIAKKKMLQVDFSDFILQNSEEGVIVFDNQLNCTQWNAAMERFTGLESHECLGKQISHFLKFLGKTTDIKYYKQAIEGKSSKVENQILFIPEKGLNRYFSTRYIPYKDALGKIIGGVAFLQDKGQYHTVLQALQEAEEKYMSLVNHFPKAIVVFSAEEILLVNTKMVELLGLAQPSEITGKPPLSFVAECDREDAFQSIQAILLKQIQEPVKYKLLKKDGSEIDTEITYLPMQYMGKQAIQAIICNVTEEKKAFSELLSHKQMLNEAQTIAKLGSYHLDINSLNAFWTDGLYKIFEIQPGPVNPTIDTYLSFAEESVRAQLLQLVQNLKEGNIPEASLIHKATLADGKEKQIKIVGKPKFNEAGEINSIVGTVQDISEIRKVEEELFRANQILNLHFENSPLGIIQLDSQLKITGWSRQAEMIFGWKAEEVIGENLSSLKFVHDDSQDIFQNRDEKKVNENFNYKKGESKLYTKKGTIVYCDLFMSGIRGEDGKVHSLLLLLNDVTARQIAQQAHLNGQLEERKRIAREIHDGIGQMLIAIKYKLAGLEDTIPEADHFKIHNLEGMMEQALEEVRSVSRNLAPRSVATLGLETSLRQMCDQIKKLTAINISFRYIGGNIEVNNVIVNALYRISQEATHNIIKHAQASIANIQVFQGRNFIELKIDDNGKGITDTDSNGMGMRNMEERAKLLGGRFQVHSEPGFGTNLIINIPLEQEQQENK